MEYTTFEVITYCWPDGVASTRTVGEKINDETVIKIELSHDQQTIHIYYKDLRKGMQNEYVECIKGLPYVAKKKTY